MRIIEYAWLRSNGVRNAWRLTKWDATDGFLAICAVLFFILYVLLTLNDSYDEQTKHIGDLNRLIEIHQAVIVSRETAIVTLLNGGMMKADNDVVTCKTQDAASVRNWR